MQKDETLDTRHSIVEMDLEVADQVLEGLKHEETFGCVQKVDAQEWDEVVEKSIELFVLSKCFHVSLHGKHGFGEKCVFE